MPQKDPKSTFAIANLPVTADASKQAPRLESRLAANEWPHMHLRLRLEAWILFAAAALSAGLWLVMKLASEVAEGETDAFDRMLLFAMRAPSDPHSPIGPRWVQETARDITALGGFTVLGIITIAAIAVLIAYRRPLQALVFGCTVGVAQVTAEAVKAAVGRPRPDIVSHLDLTYSLSFPSGHAAMAPVVYLTLAMIISQTELRRSVRGMFVIGAAALVVAIGISRVYLGVHWPTDVIAGWTLGSSTALASGFAMRAFKGQADGNSRRT